MIEKTNDQSGPAIKYTDTSQPEVTLFRIPSSSDLPLALSSRRPKICLFLPSGFDPANEQLLESRLRAQLPGILTVRSYRSPQDLQQTANNNNETQIIVVPDPNIDLAKALAIPDGRGCIEVVYYTQSPAISALSDVISSRGLDQFKMVTNQWLEVEKYVAMRPPVEQLDMSKGVNIHVLLDPQLSAEVKKQLEKDAANNSTARRCQFYAYNQNEEKSLLQALMNAKVTPGDHTFVVVDEAGPFIKIKQTTAGNMIRQNNPLVSVLLISQLKFQNGKKQHPKTAAIFENPTDVALWIQSLGLVPNTRYDTPSKPTSSASSSIPPNLLRSFQTPSFPSGTALPAPVPPLQQNFNSSFRSASPELRRVTSPQRFVSLPPKPQQPKPTIFVQETNSNWRYFLNKYATVTKRFFAGQYEKNQDLLKKVKQVMQRRPGAKIWVLLESVKEMEKMKKELKELGDVGFVVFDPNYSRPTQTDELIIGADHRNQIESYLVNYTKQSRNIISPSHLEGNKNILLLFYNKIPLNIQELALWKQRLPGQRVEIATFMEGSKMMKAISLYTKSSIFVVIPQSLDNQYADALICIPNVKRIILCEPPNKRPNYYEHPSITYVANNIQEINEFLRTLRYSLRNPPRSIQTNFKGTVVNVCIPRDKYSMEFLQFIVLFNPTIRIYPYSSFEQLTKILTLDPFNDALVIGDSSLKNKNLRTFHPSVHLIIDNEFNRGTTNFIVMATDEQRQVLLYIKNLPFNRFRNARQITSSTDLYFDSKSQQLKPILAKAQSIMQVNPSLSIYTYSDMVQLDTFLTANLSESKALIVTNQKSEFKAGIQALIMDKRKDNKDVSGVIFQDKMVPTSPGLYIFNDPRSQLIVEFIDNIPHVDEETNQHQKNKTDAQKENSDIPKTYSQNAEDNPSQQDSVIKNIQKANVTTQGQTQSQMKLKPQSPPGNFEMHHNEIPQDKFNVPPSPSKSQPPVPSPPQQLIPAVFALLQQPNPNPIPTPPENSTVLPTILPSLPIQTNSGSSSVLKSKHTTPRASTLRQNSTNSKASKIKPPMKPAVEEPEKVHSELDVLMEKLIQEDKVPVRYSENQHLPMVQQAQSPPLSYHIPLTENYGNKSKPQPQYEDKPSGLTTYKTKPQDNDTEDQNPIGKPRISGVTPSFSSSLAGSDRLITIPVPTEYRVVHQSQHPSSSIQYYASKPSFTVMQTFHQSPPKSPISSNYSFGPQPRSNISNISSSSSVRNQPPPASFTVVSPSPPPIVVNTVSTSSAASPHIVLSSGPAISYSHPKPSFIAGTIKESESESEETTQLVPVAVLYSDNVEGVRFKDFIEKVSDKELVLGKFPFRNLQDIQKFFIKDYDTFDKVVILLSNQYRGLLPMCKKMEDEYKRMRCFLLNDPQTLTQICSVFNFGWQWAAINLPYKVSVLPNQLQLSRRTKILLPSQYFKDLHRKVLTTEFMRYDSVADAESILAKQCDPCVYNILVTTHDKLLQTYRLPMHYDNTKLVVLTSDDGTSQRQFFDYFGDLFWLYADNNVKGIEGYLMSLTRKKPQTQMLNNKDMLFYLKKQMHYLHFFDYLGYFKVQYLDPIDMDNKVSVLLPKSSPTVKAFVVKDDSSGIKLDQIPRKPEIKSLAQVALPVQASSLPIQPQQILLAPIIVQSQRQFKLRPEVVSTKPTTPTTADRPSSPNSPRIKKRPSNWICQNGEFILNTDAAGLNKQRMLMRMFDIKLFTEYNDFGFYYLSNSAEPSPIVDLQYKTAEKMTEIYHSIPNKLMVVFCDKGDEKFIPMEMQSNPRVKIVKICQDGNFFDSLHLKCQELEPVIERVKTIEKNGRVKYVLYKGKSNQCEVLLQEFMLHQKDFQAMEFANYQDFSNKLEEIKNKYRKLQIICPEAEQATLRKFIEANKMDSVAFMTARENKQDDSELPSESVLKKQIETLRIYQSPRTVGKIVSKTPSVIKHSAKIVTPDLELPRPTKAAISDITQEKPSSNSILPPFPNEKVRTDLRNQGWLHNVCDRIEKSSRILIIYEDLTVQGRDLVEQLAQLTNKVGYVKPNSPDEFQSFLKLNPHGVFLLVGSNEFTSPSKQVVHIDQNDLEKIMTVLKKQKNSVSSVSLRVGPLVLGNQSRQGSEDGDAFKKKSRELLRKRTSSKEEKTSQINQGEIIKTKIDARQNRFIGILNGEELTIFVPYDNPNLRTLISTQAPDVHLISYDKSTKFQEQLPKFSKRPVLILVPDARLIEIPDLTDRFYQARIIALSHVEIKDPSVCLSLGTDKQVLELVKRLRDRNHEVDQRRIQHEMKRLSKQQEELFGYAMTLTLKSLSQKIFIFSSQSKHTNVKNLVEKYNSNRVTFVQYEKAADLREKLKDLGQNVAIVISNDQQIDDVEGIPTTHLRVYYIRSYTSQLKYSKQALTPNQRLIFTGGSSKQIANFLNSLVYRSFKKLSKTLQGRRNKSKKMLRPNSQQQNSFHSRKSGKSINSGASANSLNAQKNEYYINSERLRGSKTSINAEQPKLLRKTSSSRQKKSELSGKWKP